MSTDPDDQAMADAAVVLERMLKEQGLRVSKQTLKAASHAIVCEWLKRRGYHWATRRGRPAFSDPDALTIGFAEASLGQIADRGADLPFNLPLGEWAHGDAARLFAIAHEAVQATAENTLEDQQEPKGLAL